MTPASTSQRRLFAVMAQQSRLDVSTPLGVTLGEALAAVGVDIDPDRHALVARGGVELPLDTPVVEVEDGALMTVVDLTAAGGQSRTGSAGSFASRHDYYTPWWLIATAGALLGAAALAALATSSTLLDGSARVMVAVLLGVGALASAALWTRRVPGEQIGSAITMLAPLALAFAAGTFAVPQVAAAPHLAVSVGMWGMTLVSASATVTARTRELRAVAGTATAILLTVAGIWASTLMLGWSIGAAAAVSIGIVAPGMRMLPATLMNLPDGYAINYQHFMSNRWSVRGTVPEDPGMVTMEHIRPYVTESSARLAAGTVMLSLLAPVVAPFMLSGLGDPHVLVRSGAIGVIAATVLGLMLLPRHGPSGPLRWIPRACASVVLLEVGVALAWTAGPLQLLAGAAVLMVAALGTVAVMVPLSRGTRLLKWSRVGDALQAIAVALALPAALLAADALEQLRRMMSG